MIARSRPAARCCVARSTWASRTSTWPTTTDHRTGARRSTSIAWALRDERVTSVLLGASRVEQLEQNVAALGRLDFDAHVLEEIDRYAEESGINLWQPSP